MTIPLTHNAFERWRKRQTFATPELAKQALWAECDLEMLPKLDPARNFNSYPYIQKSLAKFAEAMTAARCA